MKKTLILNFFFILGSFLLPNFIKAQAKSLSFEEVEKLQKTTPKWHLVFIHTDWCKYCKAMQQTAFKNEKVVKLLNENFYFTAFNAEEKSEIRFLGKVFTYQPNGKNTGINQLNSYLSNGKNQEIYPRIAFLSPNGKVVDFLEGFIPTKDFLKFLTQAQTLP